MPEQDDGHKALIMDLAGLLAEAESFQFHDFKNSLYATPKVQLVLKLRAMAELAQNGRYDN